MGLTDGQGDDGDGVCVGVHGFRNGEKIIPSLRNLYMMVLQTKTQNTGEMKIYMTKSRVQFWPC